MIAKINFKLLFNLKNGFKISFSGFVFAIIIHIFIFRNSTDQIYLSEYLLKHLPRLIKWGIIGSIFFFPFTYIVYYVLNLIKKESENSDEAVFIVTSFLIFILYPITGRLPNGMLWISFFIPLIYIKRKELPLLLKKETWNTSYVKGVLLSLIWVGFLTTSSSLFACFNGIKKEISTLFALFFSAFALTIPIVFLTNHRRIYLTIISIPLLISLLLNVGYISIFGSELLQLGMYDIIESNAKEASEFFELYASSELLLLLFSFVAIGIIVLTKIDNQRKEKIGLFVKITISLILLVISLMNQNYSKTPTFEHFEAYNSYQVEFKQFISKRKKRMEKHGSFDKIVSVNETKENETYVLVIGESTSKWHMGLYGYHRNTNPILTKNKNDLYVYEDVLSPHCHTLTSLIKVLNFANYENMNLLNEKGSIVEYMNEAGFKTFWISNQRFLGEWESPTSIIAYSSDKVVFINEKDTKHDVSYDENLFSPLEKALNDKAKKKFIIVHLLGTHAQYHMRYPDEYNIYKSIDDIPKKEYLDNNKKQRINTYDNSIVYNDFVVDQIIKKIERKKDNSYMLYLSDHGDEVYDTQDFVGHLWSVSSLPMFEIPMILWLSPKYKKHNLSKVESISKSLKNKYQTDDVIHTIIDLSNLKSSDYDEKRSVINDEFFEKERIRRKTYL